ncbi:hypothetical protein [Desulfofalx alkaliphila]|uniref:hypothetical protein n=1 Tax=Desulfofalx alkaliphila TaxID=105483 RepID=UPI0006919D0E|nr:hypothetical protein [Desulfofalx alkaliphila]
MTGHKSIKKARQLGLLPSAGAQKNKPTEAHIQRQIRDYLQWHGWFVVKIHQSLGSYKGIADLYAIKNGRSVWIEVKTPRGRQSQHQEKFQRDIEDHGGEYMVARCVEDVMGLEGDNNG